MAMSLPVRFRSDGVRVAVETDPLHAPLRDFLINDLGEDVAAIVRAQGRLRGAPAEPWQEHYRYHRLDFDGTIVHVRDIGGWASCDLDPTILRQCLDEYLQEVGTLQNRRSLERAVTEPPPNNPSLTRPTPNEPPTQGPPPNRTPLDGAATHRPPPHEPPLNRSTLDESSLHGAAVNESALNRASLNEPIGGAAYSGTVSGGAVFGGTAPGESVAATLALGSVSWRTQGWGLVRTQRSVLEDLAGLTPHPDACLPHGVLETGTGPCWADLAVLDETGKRLRSGTKTFMPRGIDPERLMAELGTALPRARFVSGIPGAWSGVVAGVPVHGYVDPESVLRLPCEPIEVGGVLKHVRVFFPELADSGVDLVSAASSASVFPSTVNGPRHVLAAFLLHDVQCHRHHLEVVRGARPGWEYTGNACHLRVDAQAVRLEHLWLPGHACEVPIREFGGALYEYERLLAA
ncbi:hypothetical protein ACFOY4_23080 [Actinomadura syzygii]|uniref:Uncharacterized protein n=1 Tax=Actinomadura syzygii TaxID=1427538 RepID=A0A5D0UKP3_9ACTN|nr:hypothetical protein [Actinomadura syzygii]TYC18664.1 hypothetical protein FXF65_02620 [Actinomadura syzygii]